jgi:hypothetical protein
MDAHLDCEVCMKLWAEYAAATRQSLSGNPITHLDGEGKRDLILEKMRLHFIEEHQGR